MPRILAEGGARGNRHKKQAYPPFFFTRIHRARRTRAGFPPFFALWRYNASIICPGQASAADFFRGRPEINLCVVSLSNTLIAASNDSALLVKVTALSRAIFTKRG